MSEKGRLRQRLFISKTRLLLEAILYLYSTVTYCKSDANYWLSISCATSSFTSYFSRHVYISAVYYSCLTDQSAYGCKAFLASRTQWP